MTKTAGSTSKPHPKTPRKPTSIAPASTALDTPERVTPSGDTGSHSYDLSPDGQWAFHIHSSFTHPPVTELVHLPDHKVVRVLQTNEELAAKGQGPALPAH